MKNGWNKARKKFLGVLRRPDRLSTFYIEAVWVGIDAIDRQLTYNIH